MRSDPYQPYRTDLLAPQRVRELSLLQPSRVIFDTFGCWTVIVLMLGFVKAFPTWWSVCLAIPIIGSRYYALFIIGHDGLHRRIFKRKSTNDLFNDLFIFGAIGAITRINNKNHLAHHAHLASAADPDRHKHGCFNKVYRFQLLSYLTGATSLLRSVRNVFCPARATTSIAKHDSPNDAEKYCVRDIAIICCWQILLIGSLTWAIGIWAYPVLWLAPVYFFTFLADNLRSFLEHSQPESDVKADDHRLITYTSNPIERLFLSPMNMNYHATHHLWPSIPYYNLPTADREIRDMPGAMELEWRDSYVGYLWRYIRALPLLSCLPQNTMPVK